MLDCDAAARMLATHRLTGLRAVRGYMAAAFLLTPAATVLALPLIEEVTPGVYAVGEDNRHQSANSGWVTLSGQTILIDFPRSMEPGPYLEEVRKRGSLDGRVVAAAGWTREPGDGRLCYLASGHTREALGHPMFQRLMHNALAWLLGGE